MLKLLLIISAIGSLLAHTPTSSFDLHPPFSVLKLYEAGRVQVTSEQIILETTPRLNISDLSSQGRVFYNEALAGSGSSFNTRLHFTINEFSAYNKSLIDGNFEWIISSEILYNSSTCLDRLDSCYFLRVAFVPSDTGLLVSIWSFLVPVANATWTPYRKGTEMQARLRYFKERSTFEVLVASRGASEDLLLNISTAQFTQKFQLLRDKMYLGIVEGYLNFHGHHVFTGFQFNSSHGAGPSQCPACSGSAQRKTLPAWLSIVLTLILGICIGAFSTTAVLQIRKFHSGATDDAAPCPYFTLFTYDSLVAATKDFAHILGSGGQGMVYFGEIGGSQLAVKKFTNKDASKQSTAELSVLSRLQHPNLVPLKGWCYQNGTLLLAYSYMPNGSLKYHRCLPWQQRLYVARGIAEALGYLHANKIIHRDVKPSNVLLDNQFMARLGDFGLARFMHGDSKHPETISKAGTIGYIAPEIAYTGKASVKSDVYGFGILLLEVATGYNVLDEDIPTGNMGLVDWVWNCHIRNTVLEAADHKLKERFDVTEMERMLTLGLLCSHPDAGIRPSMTSCCKILNGTTPAPALPLRKPATFGLFKVSECLCCQPT